jgi:hypothetical protein
MTTKKYILHTGFEIELSNDNKNQIQNHLENIDVINHLKSNIIVAAKFHRNCAQNEMESFYKKNSRKDSIIGYVKNLFIREEKNVILATIIIEAQYYYIILTNTLLNSSPLELKQLADKGDFGNPIPVELKVNAKSYITYNEPVK